MGRFETGDRGANEIKTTPGRNLHAVWDNFIIGRGSESKLSNAARRLAVEITSNRRNRRLPVDGGIDDWIAEGWELAKTNVYSPHIRDYIASREHGGEFGKVQLSKQFLRDGSELCRQRAYEAGRRLAAAWVSGR